MTNFANEEGFAIPKRQYNFTGSTRSPYRAALEAMLPNESIRITEKKDVNSFRQMAHLIKKTGNCGRRYTFRTLGPSEWRVWRV